MKKALPIIISLVLILVGLTGLLISVLPAPSAEYDVIADYVEALNECDAEDLEDLSAYSAVTDALGGMLEEYGVKAEKESSKSTNNKLKFLQSKASDLASILPEDAKSVEEITLISCVKEGEKQEISMLSVSGTPMLAQIEITYKNAKGKTETATDSFSFVVMEIDGDEKLMMI